jgi:hypothetical protein
VASGQYSEITVNGVLLGSSLKQLEKVLDNKYRLVKGGTMASVIHRVSRDKILKIACEEDKIVGLYSGSKTAFYLGDELLVGVGLPTSTLKKLPATLKQTETDGVSRFEDEKVTLLVFIKGDKVQEFQYFLK